MEVPGTQASYVVPFLTPINQSDPACKRPVVWMDSQGIPDHYGLAK